MESLAPLLVTAMVLGALHAFAPDHLAAVSVLLSHRPSWRRAAAVGARWGMGHGATIALVGSAVLLGGLQLPERFGALAERAVGAVLILLGVLAIARAARVHGHWHAHDDGPPHWHLHSHRVTATHEHSHRAALGMGMLHGLAGSGALIVAIPLAAADTPAAVGYLIAFGLGTTISMALFSAAAGWLMIRAARVSRHLHRGAIGLAGLASIAIGIWWMVVS